MLGPALVWQVRPQLLPAKLLYHEGHAALQVTGEADGRCLDRTHEWRDDDDVEGHARRLREQLGRLLPPHLRQRRVHQLLAPRPRRHVVRGLAVPDEVDVLGGGVGGVGDVEARQARHAQRTQSGHLLVAHAFEAATRERGGGDKPCRALGVNLGNPIS